MFNITCVILGSVIAFSSNHVSSMKWYKCTKSPFSFIEMFQHCGKIVYCQLHWCWLTDINWYDFSCRYVVIWGMKVCWVFHFTWNCRICFVCVGGVSLNSIGVRYTVLSLLEVPYLIEMACKWSASCHKLVTPPHNRSPRCFQCELYGGHTRIYCSNMTSIARDHQGNHNNLFYWFWLV